MSDFAIDQLCINTIRTLCIDAIQQANSGHPGTPMAMAPVVYRRPGAVHHADAPSPGGADPVAAGFAKGGRPEVLLMATGSELSLCVSSYEQLEAQVVAAAKEQLARK